MLVATVEIKVVAVVMVCVHQRANELRCDAQGEWFTTICPPPKSRSAVPETKYSRFSRWSWKYLSVKVILSVKSRRGSTCSRHGCMSKCERTFTSYQ